jgi:hypothetical protein
VETEQLLSVASDNREFSDLSHLVARLDAWFGLDNMSVFDYDIALGRRLKRIWLIEDPDLPKLLHRKQGRCKNSLQNCSAWNCGGLQKVLLPEALPPHAVVGSVLCLEVDVCSIRVCAWHPVF